MLRDLPLLGGVNYSMDEEDSMPSNDNTLKVAQPSNQPTNGVSGHYGTGSGQIMLLACCK